MLKKVCLPKTKFGRGYNEKKSLYKDLDKFPDYTISEQKLKPDTINGF